MARLSRFFLAAAIWAALAPCAAADLFTFQPSATLKFADVFYGATGSYVDVSGSADVGGTFTLNQAIVGEDPRINVSMDLIIGPNSIVNVATTSWIFDPTVAPNQVIVGQQYSLAPRTLSTSAGTWLADETPVTVLVSLIVTYSITVRGEYLGPGEFMGQPIEVYATDVLQQGSWEPYTSKTVLVKTPEPASLLLFSLGAAVLARRLRR